jgi:hypothetical protein
MGEARALHGLQGADGRTMADRQRSGVKAHALGLADRFKH